MIRVFLWASAFVAAWALPDFDMSDPTQIAGGLWVGLLMACGVIHLAKRTNTIQSGE